jgi:hypothetical protein
MATQATTISDSERQMKLRFDARLEQEVARVQEDARRAVEEFKRTFPPPSDEQIERLLYPELGEFPVELGGRRFALRELPALAEKKFLRLVEQKLPALVSEILSFDERLGENAAQSFTRLFARAGASLDLVTDACVLVLDPAGTHGVTREFVQQHASTARQLRILKAQLLLNGARDFLSQLFPALRDAERPEVPALEPRPTAAPIPIPVQPAPAPAVTPAPPAAASPPSPVTPGSPLPSPGSSSCGCPPAPSPASSPWANLP